MLINDEAYEIALGLENKMDEIAGPKHNKLILLAHECTTLKADDDETAWCSSGMNLFMVLACIKRNPFQAHAMLVKYRVPESAIIELFSLVHVPYLLHEKALSTDKLIVVPTFSAAARSWLSWGISVKNNPKEGDVCIFSRGSSKVYGHVAFYRRHRWAKTWIETYGGNQNNKLCLSNYSRVKLLDIRRAAQ